MNERACRQIVRERSEMFCERCCSNRPVTMHHRVKRGQGGSWCPSNIVALCGHGTAGCHGWVEHNPIDAAKTGFHVAPSQSPRLVPLRWRDSTWVLLLPDGGFVYIDVEGFV